MSKGQTYILGIEVNRDVRISIGKLGSVSFSKGFYLYIGSAKNRLNARLRRHLSADKKLFWHIDYLLTSSAAYLKQIWTDGDKRECAIVSLINNNLNSKIVRGFGSSDCRCPGHLVFINRYIHLVNFLKKQGFRQIRF
jgi:Uri superfamily endonuclease